MSADLVSHFFRYRDSLIGVPSHMLVSEDGGLLVAHHLPLRQGDVVLDRIIHEAPAYLKFDRTCVVGSTL